MDLEAAIIRVLEELGLEQLQIEFERTESGRLGGFVISPSFAGKSQTERQDLIWNVLEKSLPASGRSRIVSLLTLTPREAAIPRRTKAAAKAGAFKKAA